MTPNGPVSRGDLFAFYGLLRSQAKGHPHGLGLTESGRYLGPCQIRGALYDLGDYPGLLPGEALCQAELYRLDRPDLADALDAFEDVSHSDPAQSLYIRQPVPVLDTVGTETGQTAWAYMYNRPAPSRPPLPEGLWPGCLDALKENRNG